MLRAPALKVRGEREGGAFEIEGRNTRISKECGSRERARGAESTATTLERGTRCPTTRSTRSTDRLRLTTRSLTTVYRVLETLVGLGVIRRLHHPGPSARFDGKIRRHHHLVCKTCSRVIDVDNRSLDELTLPSSERQGFEIEDYSVHFTGVCAECRRKVSE